MTENKNDESDFDLLLDSYKNMKSQNSFINNEKQVPNNININKYEGSKEKEKPEKKKFKFGYEILLLQPNENGLMENFLTENIIDSNIHNQSDFYNYGLDKDQWLKLINHSILMHYERHLQEEAKKKNINNNENINKNVQNLTNNFNNNSNIINNYSNIQAQQQFYNLMMRNNMYNIFQQQQMQQQNFNLQQQQKK